MNITQIISSPLSEMYLLMKGKAQPIRIGNTIIDDDLALQITMLSTAMMLIIPGCER